VTQTSREAWNVRPLYRGLVANAFGQLFLPFESERIPTQTQIAASWIGSDRDDALGYENACSVAGLDPRPGRAVMHEVMGFRGWLLDQLISWGRRWRVSYPIKVDEPEKGYSLITEQPKKPRRPRPGADRHARAYYKTRRALWEYTRRLGWTDKGLRAVNSELARYQDFLCFAPPRTPESGLRP
jgi:hypothetical protein